MSNSKASEHPLLELVASQNAGESCGIYSICSANEFVLEASMYQAKADGTDVLIESTSNQVDQFGGYTGMKPGEFVEFVGGIAKRVGLGSERVLLGGDHLGPNAWQGERAADAMGKARELIRAYVSAGYTKIHLDCSMRCVDDGGDGNVPLSDEVVAERAADLCAVAEATYGEMGVARELVYVIGTEVPIPGGAQEELDELAATSRADAERTIEVTREAFEVKGLSDAWGRVVGVVVQPGVEFGDDTVVEYDREKAGELKGLIEGYNSLVYEAHSTDYQTMEGLRELVEDHFAILKVGPWLTFALREAVFGLAEIEREWLVGRRGVELSNVREVLEEVMVGEPGHWVKHYHGDDEALRYARKYSYSDRVRYYWPDARVSEAVGRLLANLEADAPPLTLVSQYLPRQYDAVRSGEIGGGPRDLIRSKIMEVTEIYSYACGMSGEK